jgi:hypothetical protein
MSIRLDPYLNAVAGFCLTEYLGVFSDKYLPFHARTIFDDIAIAIDSEQVRFNRGWRGRGAQV